jgi:[ribosomal protein S5]-alanine N-acetyltransferase
MPASLVTERLDLKSWELSDVADALAIYGAPSVARWMSQTMQTVETADDMRSTLLQWRDEDGQIRGAAGHWAVYTRCDTSIVGGVSLQFAPSDAEDLTIAWALAPKAWGRGYASEAGEAVIRWAMHEQGATEVFAILQHDNARAAATARRMGMEW